MADNETVLLDRDDELARINGLIAASVAGDGQVLVIEGRSGVGKSVLLAELRSRAQDAGLAVHSARGSELEREFSFGIVRQLFEMTVHGHAEEPGLRSGPFRGAAALAAPALGLPGPDKAGGQLAALHGLYWLAANLAEHGPLLLMVDDAHWADEPSLRWLGYLQTRLEGLPILVALTTRLPGSAGQVEALGVIVADPGTELLELGPLREASVAAMLRMALGEEPDPGFTEACLRATSGNPLALRSVMRDLVARGVRPTGAAAAGLDRRAPTTIARRVLAQLARLGEPASRLCAALAVLGDGTQLAQVATLAQLDQATASGIADDLGAADILAPDRPLRFVHPLLRAAVYDDMPPGARSRLHGRAASLLAWERADAELIAAHLLRCEPGGEPRAVELLRAAAPRALARGVPGAAIAYLRRALQDAGPARGLVLAELGRAEVLARDPGAAGHLQEALAGCSDPVERARIYGDLADAALQEGRELLSLDWLQRALDELRDRHPEASARIEAVAATIVVHNASLLSRVPDPVPRLRALARSGGPASRPASMPLAFLLAVRGENCQEIRSSVERGLDGGSFLAAETADSPFVGYATYALLFADELDLAIELASDVLADAARRGSVLGAASGAATRAFAGHRAGRLADAEADALTALELARQHGLAHLLPYATAYLAGIMLDRGRREEAEKLVEEASLPGQLAGSPAEVVYLEARGRVRCMADAGRAEAGIADLRACGQVLESLRIRNPNVSPWRSLLAAAVTPTARKEAHQFALEDLELARRTGIPRAIGVALRAAAASAEDGTAAVEFLDGALEALAASPAVLDQARVLLDRGMALRRLGHLIDAREPLRQALDIAARCGAVPLADRAREEALLAGARPRRARLLGVHALTPAEFRVARLAAEGRSNREIAQALFITDKTVKDHLGRSYAKLGISSRGELPVVLFPSGGGAGGSVGGRTAGDPA